MILYVSLTHLGLVDFIPLMETLTFMPTDQVKCIEVAVVDDDIALEEDEQFRIDINTQDGVPGLQLGVATTFVTIIDNDGNTTTIRILML